MTFCKIVLLALLFSLVSLNAQATNEIKLEHLYLAMPYHDEDGVPFNNEPKIVSVSAHGKPLSFSEVQAYSDASVGEINVNEIGVHYACAEADRCYITQFKLSFGNGYLRSLTHSGENKDYDVTPLANLGGTHSISNLFKDDAGKVYVLYELEFEKGVRLRSNPVGAKYKLDPSAQFKAERRDERLIALRAQIQSGPNVGVGSIPDVSRLRKESPALKEMIDEFMAPIEAVLLDEVGEEKAANIETALDLLETTLYRIAAKVDALYFRTTHDPTPRSGGLIKDKESLDRLKEEHLNERVQDLAELFILLTEEMYDAQEKGASDVAEKHASEAFLTIAEIYLIAGRTKGSINRQKSFGAIASLITALAIPFGETAIGGIEAMGGYAFGGTFSMALLVWDYMTKFFLKDRVYKESWFLFPFVRSWDKRNAARLVTQERLGSNLQRALPAQKRLAEDAPEWVKLVNDDQEFAPNAERLFRIIKIASGVPLRQILYRSNCSHALTD